MANQPTIWFIGEARDRELRSCLRELELIATDCDVRYVTSTSDLPKPSVTKTSADIIVALQDWPRQYPATVVHSLIAHSMPTGRLLCIYGTWCESEGRNSPDLWPHATRVAARQAAERFERELAAVRSGEPLLPLTAGRDERFEYNHTVRPDRTLVSTARVVGSDRKLKSTLEARLAANGITTAHRTGTPDVTVVVADLDSSSETPKDAVAVRTMPVPGEPCVVPMLVTDRQLTASIDNRR